MALAPPPAISVPDPTGDYARAQSWSVIMAKYADAGNWAQWAATLMSSSVADIQNLLGKDVVGADIATIKAALDAIELYVMPGAFTYVSPTAQTYEDAGTFTAPTLGTITALPAVDSIVVGAAPSTDIIFTNSDFTNSLLTNFESKISNDLTTGSTGLGATEADIFARAVARENDILAESYNAITTKFSSTGWDTPPGAVGALQAQENNKKDIRLTDVNTGIAETSAKLSQAWNQVTTVAATQLLELQGRLFDSKVMRDFEAGKARVQYAIEGFKQEIAVALAKADLNKTAISATVAANDGTIKIFTTEVDAQIVPMKAIAESNQAKAAAYGSAVASARADLEAQIIPEELKLKGVTANAQISGNIADLTIKEANLAIEQAQRILQLEVGVFQGLAQGAQQMVASSLNTVTSNANFGWSAGATTQYDGNSSANIASREKIAGV